MNQEAKIDPLVRLLANKQREAERAKTGDSLELWELHRDAREPYYSEARRLLQALSDWRGEDGSRVVRQVPMSKDWVQYWPLIGKEG
ncbi:MAG: hypothetical protein WC657_06170 [Candidatus Paceibacterota bacterium]|jgi:hypothetical protein